VTVGQKQTSEQRVEERGAGERRKHDHPSPAIDGGRGVRSRASTEPRGGARSASAEQPVGGGESAADDLVSVPRCRLRQSACLGLLPPRCCCCCCCCCSSFVSSALNSGEVTRQISAC
jgi:hypothetical protein